MHMKYSTLEFAAESRSVPLPVWPGFVFVTAVFAAEVFDSEQGADARAGWTVPLLVTYLPGLIYWLMCIYRLHKIMREQSGGTYRIKPAEATYYHFLPFFNLYWVFAWPSYFTSYLGERDMPYKSLHGVLCGAGLLTSLILVRVFDSALGMAGLFIVMALLSRWLRRFISRAARAAER